MERIKLKYFNREVHFVCGTENAIFFRISPISGDILV